MKLYSALTILLSLIMAGVMFSLPAGEAQTTAQSGPQAGAAELKMSVLVATRPEAKPSPVFRITFENVGTKDTVLNLGMMLANGKVLVPTEIRLILIDSGGESWKLYVPGPRVAGRVDDYAVPLRTGSAYSVTLPLDELFCPGTKGSKLKLKPGVYRAHSLLTGKGAQWVNLDNEIAKYMNFWKGTLQSDEVEFYIDE